MKTFCVVMQDNSSYTLQANSVFEVAPEYGAFEKALIRASLERRPHSVRMISTWYTHNEHNLPVAVAGIAFKRTRFITDQPILSR